MSNVFHIQRKKNVLGGPLQPCCHSPVTGYFRDGFCRTDDSDFGRHVVCAVMTDDFLVFSRDAGNDLISPRPEFQFPGLKAGDCWCLCAVRWQEAYEAGVPPKVILESCESSALEYCALDALKQHALPEHREN